MQTSEYISMVLIDEIVATIEKVIGDITKRIDALEAETGVEILRDIDEDRTDYRKGQLASIGGGTLKQWTGTEWRAVLNGVESVSIEDGSIIIERGDGTIQRLPIPKTPRKKAA